jgi:surface antigen
MDKAMSTPPEEQPDGATESAADTLKADGRTAALAVARGAATGGALGAVRGAATAALKTETGRKGIAIAVLAPVAALVSVGLVIGSLFGSSTSDIKGGMDLAHAYQADTVALKQSEDRAVLSELQSTADKTGVRWEVLAAIWQRSVKKSIDKGQGPLGIDMSKVKAGELTKADAGNLEKASMFLGQKLDAASAGVYKLPNHDLDAGYANITEEGKDAVRKEIPGEEAKQVRKDIRDKYIAALKTLPIKGNPDIAEQIFDLAQAWASGKEGPNDVEKFCSNDSTGGDVKLGGSTSADLTEIQKKHAQEIINQVAKRGMSQQVAVIALITAYQESHFRMYWNIRVPGSMDLTSEKDAMGSDGYSVGLFQQQVNGSMYSWGTVADAMSPQKSTDMFVDRLMKVPGWETMAPGTAAQTVQVSAFPNAYADHITLATQLVNDLKPTNGGGLSDGEETVSTGDVSNTRNLKVSTDSRVTKNIQAVETAAIAKFADKLLAIGDYRPDGEHGEGRAADLMVASYNTPAGVAAGDSIAQFYIDNKAVFNIEYLIFNDRIWLGPTLGWKKYSGNYGHMYDGNWNDTTLHKDHVHVTTGTEPGTGGEYKYTSPDGSSSVCGGTTGIGSGSAGNGDDYPYRTAAIDVPDPWNLLTRECVSFVAWRINQQMGWKPGQDYPFTMAKMGMAGRGNAVQWKAGLVDGKHYVMDKNPTPGAIAWWDANVNYGAVRTGDAGHVGIVLGVNPDGTVKIEQYNFTPYAYSVMTVRVDQVSGFIHVADIKASAPEAGSDTHPGER